MESQPAIGTSSPGITARPQSKARRMLRLLRNVVLVAFALAMTFPVSAVLIYHVPYWALPVENRDGSSAEEAVIVHANDEMQGIRIEYAYAAYHTNPFADELISQDLVFENGRTYDVLRYQSSNGEVKTFWFDISEWYGVWSPES